MLTEQMQSSTTGSVPSSLPTLVRPSLPTRSRSPSSIRSDLSGKLGPEWRKGISKNRAPGQVYYQNIRTGKWKWEKEVSKHFYITDWLSKATPRPGSSAGSVGKRVCAREEQETDKRKRSSAAPALPLSPPRVPVIPLSWQGTPPRTTDSVNQIKDLRRDQETFSNEPSLAMMAHENNNSAVKGSDVVCLVVDTNVLLDDLSIVNEFIRKPELKKVVMIPWIVLCELDKLNANDKLSLGAKASAAISYVLSEIQRSASQSSLVCQSLASHKAQMTNIQPKTNEQHIIKCAIQMQQLMVLHRNTSSEVILLTNDTGLRLQANAYNPSVHSVQHTVPLRTLGTKELARDAVKDRLERNQIESAEEQAKNLRPQVISQKEIDPATSAHELDKCYDTLVTVQTQLDQIYTQLERLETSPKMDTVGTTFQQRSARFQRSSSSKTDSKTDILSDVARVKADLESLMSHLRSKKTSNGNLDSRSSNGVRSKQLESEALGLKEKCGRQEKMIGDLREQLQQSKHDKETVSQQCHVATQRLLQAEERWNTKLEKLRESYENQLKDLKYYLKEAERSRDESFATLNPRSCDQ